MNDEQWREAWEIYAASADLESEAKESFLASASTDPEVLHEVRSMLEEAHGATLEHPPSKSGTLFGRYHIGAMLSSGGMGEVYSAVDPELGRKVAIKFLSPARAANPVAVEQLIREAKAASALNHPHIITVYEVIRAQDDVAIAMELVEGQALRKFCGEPAGIARVIHWGRQIAQALAAAHQSNIVHRDVKPENLMIRDDGILKVLDFGLAGYSEGNHPTKPADITGLGGTLNYMSPEQTRGERATSASDVFSLGLVLYELATGAHPFRMDSPIDTAHAIAQAEPKAPSSIYRNIPDRINKLLLRMLSKDPQRRPSAQEVDQQLSLAGVHKPARHPAAVAWAAILVAITGALTFGFRDRLFPASEPQFLQLTRQVNENRVTAAAISPDGKTLLFATFSGPVYRRRMSDGNTQPVEALKGLRVDRMVWFHDGSKLLINGSMTGALDRYEPGVWVMPADGGKLDQVATGAKNGVPSPDSSRVAFTSIDGSLLSVAALAGGDPRQIVRGGETTSFSSLVWSPDGKRIAFQRSEYIPPAELAVDSNSLLEVSRLEYRYEAVDVESKQIAASAKNFIMESACGLNDGSILFLRNSMDNLFVHHLWKLRTDPDTGKFLEEPQLYTHADYDVKEISCSADGRQVVAVRGVNRHPNVYVADLPPAREYPRFLRIRRLTFTDADEYPHSWTPDSRSLIFESHRNGSFDLFRQDIDQTDARPLVISKEGAVLAHMSPDGKWILFNQKHEARWKVMRMPIEGGSAETIVPDVALQGEHNCSVSPAGRCVLRTVQNQGFVIWELNPLRGKGRRLARTSWSPAIVGDWDISPDGSEVAIPNHDPRYATIRLVPLDARGGTAERTVPIKELRNLSGVVWAADGKGWYVSVRDGSRGLLLYVDREGRVLTNLLESMTPTFAVPSPDGRHVAFADWTESANVWDVRGL